MSQSQSSATAEIIERVPPGKPPETIDLGFLQPIAIALLVAGAIACYFVPRRKRPLELAALTAALLIGFELTLTHWFYLYIPWFFPFVAFVVLATRRRRVETAPAHDDAERELVPAR